MSVCLPSLSLCLSLWPPSSSRSSSSTSYSSLIVCSLDCLILGVHVEVALHRPHVLVVVARRRQDLEPDVAESVEHHDARALKTDAVLRVPAVLVLHVLGELALEGRKKERKDS
jgi:hypothetical protein